MAEQRPRFNKWEYVDSIKTRIFIGVLIVTFYPVLKGYGWLQDNYAPHRYEPSKDTIVYQGDDGVVYRWRKPRGGVYSAEDAGTGHNGYPMVQFLYWGGYALGSFAASRWAVDPVRKRLGVPE